MSFSEKIKMFRNGLLNFDKVVEGWITDALLEDEKLTDEEVSVILERRNICSGCPFQSNNAKFSSEYKEIFGKNYTTDRKEEHCSICSCPIKKKTASLSSECGIESSEKTKHLPLKWKQFKNQ